MSANWPTIHHPPGDGWMAGWMDEWVVGWSLSGSGCNSFCCNEQPATSLQKIQWKRANISTALMSRPLPQCSGAMVVPANISIKGRQPLGGASHRLTQKTRSVSAKCVRVRILSIPMSLSTGYYSTSVPHIPGQPSGQPGSGVSLILFPFTPASFTCKGDVHNEEDPEQQNDRKWSVTGVPSRQQQKKLNSI